MIETAGGVLLLIATAALAMGMGDGVLPFPALGVGSLMALAATGIGLGAHGLFRLRRDSGRGDPYWLRTSGLAVSLAVIIAGLALLAPLAFAPLGLFKIAGFPLGYYAAAQLVPIALVALLFLFARKQDRIEIEDAADEG